MSVERAVAETPDGAPAALRLISDATGRQIDAFGVTDGSVVFVSPNALVELGLSAFAGDTREWLALTDAPGVTYAYDAASGDVRIACDGQCFAPQIIGSGARAPPVAHADPGAFLNIDTVLTNLQGQTHAAGAFDLGVFGNDGFGEANWTLGARQGAEATRLETRWTIDDPGRRVRYRIGDSVARAGATTEAFRFAGLQIARDFTLEPGLLTTPTATLSGVATMPSVVDLYVDGALRLRERVEAGPFTIGELPVVSGLGAARVVVADVLGREQVTSQRFYAGREMLRPGLTDFSFALGALRENFAVESNAYGQVIASGLYRAGVTDDLTTDVRAELTDESGGVALGASWTPGTVGQFDVAVAQSLGDHGQGALARVGWMRSSALLYFSAEVEVAEPDFARIGASASSPRLRSAVSAGASSNRYGGVSLSTTFSDRRDDAAITTAAIDYTPPISRFGALSFGLLYTDDGDSEVSATVSLTTALGPTHALSQSVTTQGGRVSAQARAQQIPLPEGGIGWRVGGRAGDNPRAEAGLSLRGRFGEADIEASRAWRQTGVRAQAAFGLVWIDGGLRVSRPVRDSFALVDAGAPKVRVLRENTPIGVTGSDGRLLVTALRPYERNHLGINTDDLPIGTPLTADTLTATPRARAGVVVRFPVETGVSGEAYIVDEQGAPLPPGAILISTDQRYPVGREGRVFVGGVQGRKALRRTGAETCEAVVDQAALEAGATIVCRRVS